MKSLFTLAAMFFMHSVFAQSIIGTWAGDLIIPGAGKLPIVIHIQQSGDSLLSTMDSPAQGATKIPVDQTQFNNGELMFILTKLKVTYKGRLQGDSISGDFNQAGQSFPLTLRKNVTNSQTPVNQPLSNEKPIVLETATGKIFGTVTLPEAPGNIPVVLFIAGSGPTDRNGNNPLGVKSNTILQLAQALAKAGIASVRYDKRGIAESHAAMQVPADLKFEDYVNDAKAWLALLKKDPGFSSITVAGHSEGALIGMMAANGNANRFISIAGAGYPADEILKTQLKRKVNAVHFETFSNAIDSLKSGHLLKYTPEGFVSLLHPSVQPYLISLFKYDPRIELKKLKIPVLLLQGTKDLQISVADAEQLKSAHTKSELIIINNMNHVLKAISDGTEENIKSYSNPDLPIDTILIKSMTDFIKK